MDGCENGTLLQVATNEDGQASVYLPVERWQDVKAVRTVGQYAGAVNVILSGAQVRVLNGPTGIMVDVCVDMLSADEIKARDKAAAEAAAASLAEIHDPRIAAARAEVQARAEMQAHINEQVGEAQREEEAARVVKAQADLTAAELALEDAQRARDAALEAVKNGG